MATEASARILVIEDEALVARELKSRLTQMGWEVVNMTQHPEAVLCREAGLRYAAIALITDYDVGLEGSDIPTVTQEEVFAFFEANAQTVRQVLFRALASELPTEPIEAGPGFERV